jgi:CBS domain-containing protein
MTLGPSADEVRHAREFLRKGSLGRYLASAKPVSNAAAPAGAVLVLSPQHTVRDALAMLARANVLSAPVVDERTATFHGFCGVADVVAAFLRSDSRELLVIRHQIGPEPGAPGDAALHAPVTPGVAGAGAAPPEFAEQKVRRRPRTMPFV